MEHRVRARLYDKPVSAKLQFNKCFLRVHSVLGYAFRTLRGIKIDGTQSLPWKLWVLVGETHATGQFGYAQGTAEAQSEATEPNPSDMMSELSQGSHAKESWKDVLTENSIEKSHGLVWLKSTTREFSEAARGRKWGYRGKQRLDPREPCYENRPCLGRWWRPSKRF